MHLTRAQRPITGKSSFLAAAIFAAAAVAAPADAAVLVADDFETVVTGSDINGRAPNTSVAGTNWVATTATFLGNLTGGLSANSTSGRSAYVDLGAGYLSANKGVYDLSLDISQPSGVNGASWIGFGFANGLAGGGVNVAENMVTSNGAPWLIWRLNGQEVVFGGPGTSNALLTTATGAVATGATRNFRIVLDTTDAQWTVNAFVDGAQQDLNGAAAGNTYTYAAGSNPAARYVGISTGMNGAAATGSVDNLLLTGPVPEPGTIALATAALGLLSLRRRRPNL